MEIAPISIQDLIEILSQIPGIGHKTAERIAFYIVVFKGKEFLHDLINKLIEVQRKIKICSECGLISENDPCPVCTSPIRRKTVICVIEKSNDAILIEKTNEFKGLYHVLGGVISPIEGMGPGELNIPKLMERIKSLNVEEVFIAMDPDSEGEITTAYLATKIKELKPEITITTIAKGIPMGGNIEYSDIYTLSRAIRSRNRLE